MAQPLPYQLDRSFVRQPEAIDQLGISRRTFYRLRDQGLFECRRYGGRVLVRKTDIARYLKNLPLVGSE